MMSIDRRGAQTPCAVKLVGAVNRVFHHRSKQANLPKTNEKQTNKQTNKRTNEQTNKRTDEQTNEQASHQKATNYVLYPAFVPFGLKCEHPVYVANALAHSQNAFQH
jgi:hypothetical protein